MGQRQDRRHERDETGLGGAIAGGADLQWGNSERGWQAAARINNIAAQGKFAPRSFTGFGVSFPKVKNKSL